MQGKVLNFKGEIKNFKADGVNATITITADTKDIVLDALNEMSNGPVMVNLEASQTELLPEDSNATQK